MLTLENVSAAVGQGTALEKSVLQSINLEVSPGEFVVIIGGNGAGKSTLLGTITGAVRPSAGRIFIDGKEVTRAPQNKRCALIASVAQDPKAGTLPHLTLEENLSFAAMRGQTRLFWPYSTKKRALLFREKLATLEMGLEDRLSALVGQLSGGQRQALSLVMALMAECKILLLDEITAALDPTAQARLMDFAAKRVAQEKRTCLMITHNLQDALKYGDRLIALERGQIERSYDSDQKRNLSVAELIERFY